MYQACLDYVLVTRSHHISCPRTNATSCQRSTELWGIILYTLYAVRALSKEVRCISHTRAGGMAAQVTQLRKYCIHHRKQGRRVTDIMAVTLLGARKTASHDSELAEERCAAWWAHKEPIACDDHRSFAHTTDARDTVLSSIQFMLLIEAAARGCDRSNASDQLWASAGSLLQLTNTATPKQRSAWPESILYMYWSCTSDFWLISYGMVHRRAVQRPSLPWQGTPTNTEVSVFGTIQGPVHSTIEYDSSRVHLILLFMSSCTRREMQVNAFFTIGMCSVVKCVPSDGSIRETSKSNPTRPVPYHTNFYSITASLCHAYRASCQQRSYHLYTGTSCTASRHARPTRTKPEPIVIHSLMSVLLLRSLRTLKTTCNRVSQVRNWLPTQVAYPGWAISW